MNTVEPIRDIELIYDIGDYLKRDNQRNYMMFMFGILTGLRISDILKVKVRNVRDKGKIVKHLCVIEEKTNKDNKIKLHDDLRVLLEGYTRDMKDYEYLFKSQKGVNKPISRQQAYRILNKAAKVFDLKSIGCHTLRKTFGYHMYNDKKDIVTIKEILNHSDISITLRYIGVNQDKKDEAISSLNFVRNSKKRK